MNTNRLKQILHCTLNTHNFRDMNSVLGNYLSYGDLIIVHMSGQVREVTIKKTQEFLGLTITDNANGRAFIKKVKSDDRYVEDNIKPGDHIVAINSESTVGQRHYEVAKAIRLLPPNTNFTLRLMEPKYSDRFLDLTTSESDGTTSSLRYDSSSLRNSELKSQHKHELSEVVSLSSTCDELINSSLPIDKLLSKIAHRGPNDVRATIDPPGDYKETIEKINSLLESFLGIDDNLLAIRIYRLARENKNSYDTFSSAFEASELGVFKFDEDMRGRLWKCARNPPMQ